MGNKTLNPVADQYYSNILSYQKKEVLNSFSRNELTLIYLLFDNLKQRSIHPGIDSEAFHHFVQIPGLWGQRFWIMFQRPFSQPREYIAFDEFVFSLYLICRGDQDEQDQFIFDMFNMSQGEDPLRKKHVTKEEVRTMVYNLPNNGVIVGNKRREDPSRYEYHIKISQKVKTHERLIIDDKKYFHIMPQHINTIVDQMIDPISENGLMDLKAFQTFLSQNPALKTLIKLAVKPQLWTLNDKGYAQFRIEDISYDITNNASKLTNLSIAEIKSKTTEGGSQQSQKPNSIAQKRSPKKNGNATCFSSSHNVQRSADYQQSNGAVAASREMMQPGVTVMQGELLKQGKKTDMWVKRYYVLKDSALIAYREAKSRTPSSVIYLNGLYIDSYFTKGIKGFRIFHNSDYFKEKVLYHKDAKYLDKWIEEVKSQAFYYEVNKRYEKISTLGKGKFSTVYLCRSQESDEYVAMKLIDKKQLSVREREFLIDEIQIIGGINHPNIITIKESFETLQHMYIMMESMQGGELFDHIKEYEISEKEAALIVSQILEALQYLHMCGIVHRDLKPENILVECDENTNEVLHVKLTDFGLSKIIVPGQLMFESCGTPAYVAPEVLTKNGYGQEVDIWSCGVILYTMLARCLPFHSSDRKKTFKLIREAELDLTGSFWDSVSTECKDLITNMLIKDPQQRMSIEAAIKHPFLAKFEKYIEEVKTQFNPQIDQVTGQVRVPRKSSCISGSQEGRVNEPPRSGQLNLSQTDYASMVSETENGRVSGQDMLKNIPASSIKKQAMKPFIQPGMRHLEKLSSGSVHEEEEERKDNHVSQKKKQRLQEINAGPEVRNVKQKKQIGELGLVGQPPQGGLNVPATRTLQPITGFDIDNLIKDGDNNGERAQKADKLVILKTHRYFSDHLDEEHEQEHHL